MYGIKTLNNIELESYRRLSLDSKVDIFRHFAICEKQREDNSSWLMPYLCQVDRGDLLYVHSGISYKMVKYLIQKRLLYIHLISLQNFAFPDESIERLLHWWNHSFCDQ